MDEEKTNKAYKTEGTGANNDAGLQSETERQIERLKFETERLNQAIAEKENADARAKLGGVTYGNQKPVENIDPKEKAKAYAQKVMSGKLE